MPVGSEDVMYLPSGEMRAELTDTSAGLAVSRVTVGAGVARGS